MAPVTLYMVKISPTCRVVWLYLLQNGIEHETIDITCIDDIQKLSHMDKLSGHTDVPILTDGSVVVFEAPAILEYLGKHYTNYAGFGKTVTTQSKCSSMLSWTNSEVHRIAGYMFAYPQFLDKYRLDSDSANENLIENEYRI
ncbi:GSTT1 [Bugula neritina]|uniref:GSTT1 n=1 Tax=Bugula neritina TaxID=10212 RepID=A0A7J7JIC8_BUGNE|nr:GSTT1 [Bugula neritina]